MEEEALVTVDAVSKHFGIPRSTLYWLVKHDQLRVHVLPSRPWIKRRQLRFRLSEVEEDLALLPKPKP